jgi:hypothetical protein
MTGVTAPDSMSSVRATRSWAFSEGEHAQCLADDWGQKWGPERSVEAAQPPPARFRPDDDEGPAGGERAPEVGQRAVPADVDDDVVVPRPIVDVGAGVVDDVVGADFSDDAHLRRASHAGDAGPECLGDLDGECPHSAGRADDQHVLAALHVSVVANRL